MLRVRTPRAFHHGHHDGVVRAPSRSTASTHRGIVLGVER